MKVALVHELLTMPGGAEKVLRTFANIFPEAPIYTLLYNEQRLNDWFPKEKIRTSAIQKHWTFSLCPSAVRYNHHFYLNHFPTAVEAWDFRGFDLVISSSSAFAHGIITNSHPKHLCYVHSPARYLWDRTHDVLQRAGQGPLGPLQKHYLARTFHKLRLWDAEVAPRPDKLLAASQAVQRRIELYWQRESDVVYPPLDDGWLTSAQSHSHTKPQPYFLIVSTLAPYKRIDLAIAACNELKLPLKIAGDGPDRARLQRLAGPTVEFLGHQSEPKLNALYTNAQAVIFPGDEDFGLVPLEAMACGTPVIAYRSGGALESIAEGQTGTFFTEPTAPSLAAVLKTFDRSTFDSAACQQQAQQFSRKQFEHRIHTAISSL